MAVLRRELDGGVEHVAESARAMTDWTFYVRRFPWVAVGLAAAVGFLLVPRKKTSVAPTAEQLAELAKNKQFWADAASEIKPPPSMLKGFAATIATIAVRAAIAYVGEMLRAKAAGPASDPAPMAAAENGVNELEH